MTILDNYETAKAAFKTGRVLIESNETLLAHLHGLSNQNNINTGTQHRDIIGGLTINNILLQRHVEALQGHITELDAKNSRLQWWVAFPVLPDCLHTKVPDLKHPCNQKWGVEQTGRQR